MSKYLLTSFVVALSSCVPAPHHVQPHSHMTAGKLNIWSCLKTSRFNDQPIDDFLDIELEKGDTAILSNGTRIARGANDVVLVDGQVINSHILNLVIAENGDVKEAFIRTFD